PASFRIERCRIRMPGFSAEGCHICCGKERFADDPPVSVPSSSPSPSIIKKEAQKQKSDAERQKAKEEREKAEKNKGDGNSNANNNGNTTNNGGNTNDDD
ncbi:MAG: hypothetical protein J6X70_08760, partial [Muribaculaceae bacterium]|nr:hypothetical protein [Muribaculaceae bacterium]